MKIIVNGRLREYERSTISYEELVKMAGAPEGARLTATYSYHNAGGSMLPGQSVVVHEGIIFCAVDTSSA